MIWRQAAHHVLAASIAIFSASAVAAEEYRDVSRHFSFELPDKWAPRSAEFVAALNELVRRSAPPGTEVRYDKAFSPRDKPTGYPYVLVQIIPLPTSGLSYEDLETAYKAVSSDPGSVKLGGPAGDILKNVALDKPVLDRSTNRIVGHVQIEVAGIGKVRGLSVGFIGSGQLVYLHFYVPAAEFDAMLPTFEPAVNSFRFDAGFTFVPGQPSSSFSFLMAAARLGVLGGIVGGIIGGIVAVLRSRRSDKTEIDRA